MFRETDIMRAKTIASKAAQLAFIPAVLLGTAAQAHEVRNIGDGRISSEPEVGSLFSCQQQFSETAPGAGDPGDWVDGKKLTPDLKPIVDGKVTWDDHRITIRTSGDERIISSNNLPKHKTGTFPIDPDDDAYQYDRNPNEIEPQKIKLVLPKTPEIAKEPSCVPMGMIGFSIKGGAIYNALDARGRDAAAYEMLDKWGGHPQADGQYHYHDMAKGHPDGRDETGHGKLVGYALDGFGIYAEHESKNKIMKNKKLDECHGHVGEVLWDGKVKEMYHYHLTWQYPYSIGCFRGTPVEID